MILRSVGTLVSALAIGCSPPSKGDVNLANGQTYVLDPAPNYATPVAVPQGAATDGIIARDAHWVAGQSHGWQSVAPVTVELDLGEPGRISEVRVHVSRSPSASIQWPNGGYLFTTSDGQRYQSKALDGELVRTSNDGDPIEKGYLKFALNGALTRKLVVAVFATPLLFIDEIEALGQRGPGSDASAGSGKSATLSRDQLQSAIRKARISSLVDQARHALARDDRLPSALAQGRPPPWLFRKTMADNGHSCTAQRIWPWQSFRLGSGDLQQMPPSWKAGDPTLVERPAYLAWQIANHGPSPRALRHVIPGSGGESPGLSAYVLGYLPTPTPTIVGDLLLPMPSDLTIPPGESVTLILKAVPRRAGSATVEARFDCGEDSLVLAGKLEALRDTKDAPVSHLTTWAYPIDQMKGALTCRPGFMREYGVDVDAIHPNALGDLSDPAVEDLLVEQLSLSRGAARAILFMNTRSHPVFKDSMDARALGEAAGRWLGQLGVAVERSRFDGEILLFPIDEFAPDDLAWFRRLKGELASRSSYRFYGTISDPATLGVAKDLDVASINFTGQIQDKPELRGHEFYVGYEPAKEHSASRLYYLAPIRAAVRKSPGFGIWALYDSSGAAAFTQAWSDIGIGERDFGMLYFDRRQCPIPSLRLAALGAGRTAQTILSNCWSGGPPEAARPEALAPFASMATFVGKDLTTSELDPLGDELARCAAAANTTKSKKATAPADPAAVAMPRKSDRRPRARASP